MRCWVPPDREPFAELNADPEVMEHFPAPMTREESDALVDRISAHIEEHGWGIWAAEVAETGEFIGFIGLNAPTFMPGVEVGWRLKKSAWGHGYASEGARAALAYAFETLGLDEVISFTSIPNVRSQRVMERIGMTHDPERDFDHPRVTDERIRRHVLYRVTP